MRPDPLVPSRRRPLASLAALLLVTALSLGWSLPAPDVQDLASQHDGAALTLGGESCELIDVPVAGPIGLLQSCPGVRPGGIVTSDVGACTYNFVFTDGVDRYIGTAGHCIIDPPPGGSGQAAGVEHFWLAGSGPVARDAEGNRVGEFVYGVMQKPFDFALIRVDRGVPVNPQMCYFGGPTGVNEDVVVGRPVVYHYYGNGVGLGALIPARTAVSYGMPASDHIYADGLAIFGDSGAGVITSDGRAVGVIVTIGVHSMSLGLDAIDVGVVGITRLAPQIRRAEDVLGVHLTLVTAPRL